MNRHNSSALVPSIATLLSMLVMTAFMGGCSESPAEEIIKENVEALAEAIETKQADTALDFFHENFVSEKGQNKEWIKRTLLLHTIRHDQISLILSNISVELVDPGTAKAVFHVLATGGRGIIPDDGGAYRVETEWRNTGGDWQLVFARWKKALEPNS